MSRAWQKSDCRPGFAKCAAFDRNDQPRADAFALPLEVHGHLHEFAHAGLGIVWQERCGTDDAWAGGVGKDRNEMLELLLDAGKSI